ncbi:MAG TPA: S8 family serine peptidase [Pseudobdellovibrionaceae bacterium]|nr:S8 family serine peptidase [Pseudobdellovibrionaceae bacterium]
MKTALLLALIMSPVMALGALVDPKLQNFARGQNGTVRVMALMELPPANQLPSRADSVIVRKFLRQATATAFKALKKDLQESVRRGDIRVKNIFSINLSFTADVNPAGLRAMATAEGLTKIYADGEISYAMPLRKQYVPGRFTESIPYDIQAMGLDKLWKENPEIIGTGVLVGHIDTGVDGKHPALAGKIAAFYDASRDRLAEPFDADEHGSHTAGTVLGSPQSGLPLGVAPGARLISSAALSGYDHMLKAMEFMLDPDKNPDTNDQPRLVTNSWHAGGAPDMEAFYRAINAWEAAGILTIFSAGNSGPRPGSITRPKEHPQAFAVAATGPGGQIASFSSRGPAMYQGKEIAKPDLSAPGVDIVSTVPGGKMAAMSGTSMAAPHVAGLAALLYQIEPNLTPQKMRELMLRSADFVDVNGQSINEPRWNANFGFGHANAYKAVNNLKKLRGSQERRWGNFMIAPAMEIMEGVQNIAVKAQEDLMGFSETSTLFQSFPTQSEQWIDGASL